MLMVTSRSGEKWTVCGRFVMLPTMGPTGLSSPTVVLNDGSPLFLDRRDIVRDHLGEMVYDGAFVLDSPMFVE